MWRRSFFISIIQYMEHIPNEAGVENTEKTVFHDFESLKQYWEEHNQEAIRATTKGRIEFARSVAKREQALSAMDYAKALKMFDINPEAISQDEKGYFHIESLHLSNVPQLPDGYAYKGGAARYVFLRTLGVKEALEPRDHDIVRLSEEEPYPGADKELAEKLMPNDSAHGYGVERIRDVEGYFNSRDITVNEVMATSKEVICSKQALLDTARHILRLTPFEHKKYNGADSKMMAKMIRFESEAIGQFEQGLKIENAGDWKFEENFIAPFWLALHLDRAYERGYQFAQRYVESLVEKDQLPDDVKTPEQSVEYLMECLTDSDFYFRHAPVAQFEAEEDLLADDHLYDLQDELELRGK